MWETNEVAARAIHVLFNQESSAIKRNLTAILIGRRHLVGAGAYAAACEIIVSRGK